MNKIIDRKIIFFLSSFLIIVQLVIFVTWSAYNKNVASNDIKSLLLQQTMLFIQRLQTASTVQNQQAIINNLHIPNAKITVSAFPEASVHVTSKALWPIYSKLKQQKNVINVSIRLLAGSWLNVEITPLPAQFLLRYFWLGSEILLSLCLLFFFILIYRYTKPLNTITQAAQRLSIDVNANPLTLDGTTAAKQTFQAINDMQIKIQKLMQERTQMLAAISHDLRTPLTRMRLRSDFMIDPLQNHKNNQDIDEMETMITQILEFANNDYSLPQKSQLDLTTLVSALCDDFTDRGLTVTYIGTDDRILFSGSTLALKRAVTNLIDNAIKYAGAAEVNLYLTHNINLVITDKGPGIPSDQLDKVFNPFHRVDASRSRNSSGSGLGLSIARNIIHAHGGEILLQTIAPTGLQVVVVFP
ncbi:ATP-binding protein [soil metagenome]